MNGGRVTSSVRALGAQRFVASFTPHEPGTHIVQITFNGETCPGKSEAFLIHFVLINFSSRQMYGYQSNSLLY